MNAAAASSGSPYRGRFAPSPTGPLHFGSLVAATASYLQALSQGGEWLVRIEDIDPTREQPGAGDAILESLRAHGFEFGDVLWQSTRLEVYEEVIQGLLNSGVAYRCSCTRKELRASAATGLAGPVYPGNCRHGPANPTRPAISVRARTEDLPLCFRDSLQGEHCCNLASDIGDFLIKRGDGLVAYQLAVVVDDAAQKITEIVRGTDLLEATFMQVWLRRLLALPEPLYMHFPVATDATGAKLSKQTAAPEIDNNRPGKNLLNALKFLRQPTDNIDFSMPTNELWEAATAQWDPTVLQGEQSGSMMVR